MPKRKVAVITGASSGIGKATAILFASTGYDLVIAARNAKALDKVAKECTKLKVKVVAIPTDISDEEAVKALATKAVKEFKGFDVWVNNASVYMLGKFEEIPTQDYKRLIEINLFGPIYGMKEAIKVFSTQKSGGTIVNISSIFGLAAPAYSSAYAASKFALRAISESLRFEYRKSNIHIATIFPSSIDTPLYQHSANYVGKQIKPATPIYRAVDVAQAILAAVDEKKDEIVVGTAGKIVDFFSNLAHQTTAESLNKHTEKDAFTNKKVEKGPGNLYESRNEESEISGGWK